MAIIEINKNPSERELRWFGLMAGVFFVILGAIFYRRFSNAGVAYSVWSFALIVPVVYYAVPAIRKPFYLGWLYAAYPIGWTVSHLILLITYYLALTPIGIMMRLLGHDPLQRKLDRKADTYWLKHEEPADNSRYFRQF